ncbi:MAG: YadA-like family protein [Celeribacter marinus]
MKLKTMLLIGSALVPMGTGAFATELHSVNDVATVTTDNDGTGDNGIIFYGATTEMGRITVGGSSFSGDLSLQGVLYDSDDSIVDINDSLHVVGGADIDASLNVDGATTLDATSITGATSINTSGTSSTTIGATGNNTTIASSNIDLNAATRIDIDSNVVSIDATDDIYLGAGDYTSLYAGQDISLAASDDVYLYASEDVIVNSGSDFTVDATDDIGLFADTNVRIHADDNYVVAAGDTAAISSESFYVNVTPGAASRDDLVSYENGIAVAGNGQVRWVADDNGKLVQVEATDTTSGTTAAMVVTNDDGNTHGVVVQETKTVVSGGSTSSSMTLADNGATFSNSATGAPIQVHGVADGTAEFDAVNVRQLYSGLAAVLASTPDLSLTPGKSGMAIGLGGYGGYNAIGLGFGHMLPNGTIMQGSIAKGQHSEVAYKAGVSWTW